MDFDQYQGAAKSTAQIDVSSDLGKIELALGLSSETGSVSRIYKRLVRDGINLGSQSEKLSEELGDVLWYIAMISSSMDLSLSEIAENNLVRTSDRYARVSKKSAQAHHVDYEDGCLDMERFPRKMVFAIKEVPGEGGLPHVAFSIEKAIPNHFPNGNTDPNGKGRGFTLGVPIGNIVNDNASNDDGYRFHDAVHVAFMTVLGWSPVMRALLRLKRKSKEDIDRVQDGARARDLEEALSAILKELSLSRNDFKKKSDIDGEVKDIIRRVVAHLEVSSTPIWLWVDAIWVGYKIMNELKENGGGWILANLDKKTLEFHKTEPKTL